MLGVVMLNFNDSRNACKLTRKIRNFSNVWQVFLVDNCSTDDSMSYMQSELCDVSGLGKRKKWDEFTINESS